MSKDLYNSVGKYCNDARNQLLHRFADENFVRMLSYCYFEIDDAVLNWSYYKNSRPHCYKAAANGVARCKQPVGVMGRLNTA